MATSGRTRQVTEAAAAWFARLQGADVSETERQRFEEWIDADPAHAVAYARVEATWDRAARLAAAPQAAPMVAPTAAPVANRPARAAFTRRAAAAGILAVAIGAGGLWALRPGTAYATGIGERKTVTLPDGSRVTLNTNSKIVVDFDDDARTARLLRGEALFDVAPDARRPFLVQAGTARLRAGRTAFNIRMREAVVEVTVTKGQLALAGPQAQPRVAAGEGAVIGQGAVAKVELDPDLLHRRLAWRDGIIELRGETLEQAVAEFNRYRETPLVVADPRIAAIRIGGAFETDESEKFLAALRSGFNIRTVEGEGGRVFLVPAA